MHLISCWPWYIGPRRFVVLQVFIVGEWSIGCIVIDWGIGIILSLSFSWRSISFKNSAHFGYQPLDHFFRFYKSMLPSQSLLLVAYIFVEFFVVSNITPVGQLLKLFILPHFDHFIFFSSICISLSSSTLGSHLTLVVLCLIETLRDTSMQSVYCKHIRNLALGTLVLKRA